MTSIPAPYRYKCPAQGWLPITASTATEALQAAIRALRETVSPDRLQAWNGTAYVAANI